MQALCKPACKAMADHRSSLVRSNYNSIADQHARQLQSSAARSDQHGRPVRPTRKPISDQHSRQAAPTCEAGQTNMTSVLTKMIIVIKVWKTNSRGGLQPSRRGVELMPAKLPVSVTEGRVRGSGSHVGSRVPQGKASGSTTFYPSPAPAVGPAAPPLVYDL